MDNANAVKPDKIDVDSPNLLINRELSWLSFARRVLALAEDPELPLLERVKFAGIMGMLYDEFAMKRLGGIKRKIEKGKKKKKLSHGGLTPEEELVACRQELYKQAQLVCRLLQDEPDLKIPELSKQLVRDVLLAGGYDPRKGTGPGLRDEDIIEVAARYIELYERLTGRRFDLTIDASRRLDLNAVIERFSRSPLIE